jgi:hypothetical protein
MVILRSLSLLPEFLFMATLLRLLGWNALLSYIQTTYCFGLCRRAYCA